MMPAHRFDLPRRAVALLAAAALALTLAGCGDSGSGGSSGDKLTVYTDQHAELIQALTQAYTKKTGVEFNIQNDATVGQIDAEGQASPADVFLSEDPGPAAQLAKQGRFVKLPGQVLGNVRPGLSSQKGLWVAYAARSRVLYYNPKQISEKDLPHSLLDITQPQYKGRFAYAPSGGFIGTVQYLISTIGKARTEEFLKKIKANGVDEQSNGNVRDTVEAGQHAMGLSNHYYWWVKAAEVGGPSQMTSKIYHFPGVDPGNLVLSSGAGVLKTSQHQDEAVAFLKWLTSADGGQQILARNDPGVNEGQYPVAPGVSSALVGDLSQVKSPKYDMDIFGNWAEAEQMLKTLGMSS
jgi:iron(III) transport system substrate-binding protein